jgi:uncharacterized glyoxalase superfamily protein PhnB
MAGPIFDQLDLVCRSVEKAVAFYRLLGISIPKKTVWGTASGAHHVNIDFPGGLQLSLGSRKLARFYNPGFRRNTGGGNVVIGFRVATRGAVDSLYRKLTKAGHTGVRPPWDAFWGARYAIIADPDGNHVGIMSPSDPRKRSQGPDL